MKQAIFQKTPLIVGLTLFLFAQILNADLRNLRIGLWNFGTTALTETQWNTTIRGLLGGSNGADVLLLQKVQGLPSNASFLNTFVLSYATSLPIQEYQWDLGRELGKVFVYFVRNDISMRPINLAIVSKVRAQEMFIIKPDFKHTLPIFGIRIDNDVLLSMDCSNAKSDVLRSINAVFDFFGATPKYKQLHWLLAGSFNAHPQILQEALATKLQERISIIAPAVPTRKSGGIFDYAISGNSFYEQPYLALPLKAYLGYGGVRMQFGSDFVPVMISK